MAGLRPAEYYDLTPAEVAEILEGAVAAREDTYRMLAWHAVAIANGSKAKNGLRISDILPAHMLTEADRGTDEDLEEWAQMHMNAFARLGIPLNDRTVN